MANTFTLDDIRAAADKKYGHTKIGDVVLLNPLRLPKAKREELVALQEKLSEDDAEQEKLLADAIRLVAQNSEKAESLLSEIGEDLALLVTVFEKYSGEVQVGEA
jgi:hypothetical protein